MNPEAKRLADNPSPHDPWRVWGPYVSSRQWGTVREDYSKDGEAWTYFPHDHARRRAYRWGEDGIFGLCDREQRICFAPTFWNGADPILKERFFGLTGPQGNHGEDVKEEYWYLEAAPTASWLRALYRYPQRAFPYEELVTENARRGPLDSEFELRDTGIFADDRYFDIEVAYAKSAPEEILFTENETNNTLLFGSPNASPFTKDAFHRHLVGGEKDAVNPARNGTKAAPVYRRTLAPGETWTLHLRLRAASASSGGDFSAIFDTRARECAEYYNTLAAPHLGPTQRQVQQQALAGLGWNKMFYHYDVGKWLDGDPAFPPPQRSNPRNNQWRHFIAHDVLSMPDDWEYPWFACWDLAFHTIPFSLSDPALAKHQLKLLLKEWYMHPNGRLPAYEWNFGDPNPPVYAWAALRTYFADARRTGTPDRIFLEHVFHALLINFAWWANAAARDETLEVFGGGFLGLDNASPFNRSEPPPEGGYLVQSDGTSWMAMFSLNMLLIALELARDDIAYQPLSGKFLMHFLYISSSLDLGGQKGADLWDEEEGFYYDQLHLPDGRRLPIRLRSVAGLIPFFAVETVPPEVADVGRPLANRWKWFIDRRPDLHELASRWRAKNKDGVYLFSLLDRPRLERLLATILDENEFLGPFGLRSLSLRHRDHPFELDIDGHHYRVDYAPGESVLPQTE